MKKIYFAFLMTFSLMSTSAVLAQTEQSVTLKITNVPTNQGKVLLTTADGKYYAMIGVKDFTTEVKLDSIPDGAYTIYAFHDSNGNYMLDKDEDNIPVEYCAIQQIEITDKSEVYQIELLNIKDKVNNK